MIYDLELKRKMMETNIDNIKCNNCRWLVGDMICLNRASELRNQDVTLDEDEANRCDQFVHYFEDNCCNSDEDTYQLDI